MYNKLTRQDIEEMEKELEYRKVVVRKKKLEAVKEARAHGDLSENFEYYAAKQDKNSNERRIRYLDKMIKTADIISDESAEDEVGINNYVTVWYEDDEEEETFQIVTSIRRDILNGAITNESPIGKALLGHKVGDRVMIYPEAGEPYYVIIRKIENKQ